MSTDTTSGTAEQNPPRMKARSKIALMKKQFAQAMEEQKKETNSNEEETVTNSDTPNGHTNGEDSPTPTENGSHTDEQNISPTSNGDGTDTSSNSKNAGQRKWKQKMEQMREMGYMRKTASNPELTTNGDSNVGRSATLPLVRPAKEKPTVAQIEGLFAMYKKHRQPRTASTEKTDTIHIPTPKPADPPSDSQAAFPNVEEKLQEKVVERPQPAPIEPKGTTLSSSEEVAVTPISSKGSKRSVQFDPEEKKVLHFEESKAPASINPATKQLTDRISQLEEEKNQLEQQNKIYQDRIKSLESKQLSLKENSLNLEVAQQLRSVQGRLDLELSTKQVLKDYLAELQREIDTARKAVPTQQYKVMLMIQIFVWAIIIALLFVIVMRRSTPEPSLRIPH